MKSIGIFEAKTRFTALCEEVARSGEPALVSRRGKPLVVVGPVPAGLRSQGPDILTALRAWEAEYPAEESDFPEVWLMRGEPQANPLSGE
jgi:prevent-host-death family protein